MVSQRWVHRERRDPGEILVDFLVRKNLAAQCTLCWAVTWLSVAFGFKAALRQQQNEQHLAAGGR